MEPPRMWWLQVEGIRHWILAVEWSSSICNSNVNVPKEEVFDSSHHPWPAEFRAPIRSLRSLDRKLHGMSWYVDAANGIIAIGCGDNKKQKYQALKYAWILCRSWRTENNPARHAPTIRVDPQDPDDHDGQETWAVNAEYAVVLHKYDNTTSVTRAWVTGYFFSTRETARAYFEKVKYGEWAATFLGADGKQLDRWHQCYINNGPNKLEQAAREWYRQAKQQAKMAGRGPSQSVLSPQPPRDTAAPEDIKAEADNRGVTSQPPRSKADPNNIKLEADNEGVAMVEAIRAFFNGEEDTVENVFERMRRMVQIEQTIKQEASTIRVPVFELGYAQKKCNQFFRCRCLRGRKLSNECRLCPTDTVDDMIQAIIDGMDPSKKSWAVLDVVMKNGLFWTIDHRRLYAMKEAQRIIRASNQERTIFARIRVHVWSQEFDRFVDRVSHGCRPGDGQQIFVKRRRTA